MARQLRVQVVDGWYHVTPRGLERRTVFEDARDHEHFMELLPEFVARYGVKLHAYVLMRNHYHLLVVATVQATRPDRAGIPSV
jgi:REP element-mobilizing transposase RayT